MYAVWLTFFMFNIYLHIQVIRAYNSHVKLEHHVVLACHIIYAS